MSDTNNIDCIVSCSSAQALSLELSRKLMIPLLPVKVRSHPDGELSTHILADFQGKDVILAGSFYRPAHENLFEFVLLLDALERGGVKSIRGIIPYMAYSRQDRVDAPGRPISISVVANMLQSEHLRELYTMELHNPETTTLFTTPLQNLSASNPVAEYLEQKILTTLENPLLVSPDRGRAVWVQQLAIKTNLPWLHMDKKRISDREVEVQCNGDLRGKDVILLDDMIATGGSMAQAVKLAKSQSARSVICIAIHGIFAEHAETRLITAGAGQIIVSNSIPSGFSEIDLSEVFLEAVRTGNQD
ncbi:ribose-phosphate diphosphokinase [bacterium]|nr:ribose-phosphate diphosphokinase [bacterium]